MPLPIDLPPRFLTLAQSLGVRPEDITEQFTRGGGKGGQKINKTSSCVILKHLPTSIEVRSQKHREQSKNRLSAMKLLLLKIEESIRGKESEHQQHIFKLRKQKQRRSRRSKEKMLEEKRRRAKIKEARRRESL